MPRITRRKFLRQSALAGFGAALVSRNIQAGPTVFTRSRSTRDTSRGELGFRVYNVQRGRGPQILDWAYASDGNGDAFHTNISASDECVVLSDTEGEKKFAVNVRWNVEGFGYTFITADNGGEFYELPREGSEATLNLNLELARSRVLRNRKRVLSHSKGGWRPSRETEAILNLSEGYLEDARKAVSDGERCGALAQQSLLYALRAGESLEVEKAGHDIAAAGRRPGFFFGCDARAIFDMHEDLFLERFGSLFNYATITYVWNSNRVMEDFEPHEGKKQYAMRDFMFRRLREKGVTVEGRPLFWFHTWVTPAWIKRKSYDELRKYVETTTREVIGHYGDGMYAWEIVNEFHDWANEVHLTPEQTVELTRLACDVARATAPSVHRLINNCCPFAEYIQLKQWSGGPALYRQRTPWQFTKDLVDAGVDFTLLGQQMYFPYRDLQDICILIERFASFGKPVQLSEIGAPGGPTDESIKLGTIGLLKEPYPWHRPWDEALQADWLEAVYTLAYSKPYVEAANWFDFVDPDSFIDNGGLLRSPKGEPKEAFDRLKNLRDHWNNLPLRRS